MSKGLKEALTAAGLGEKVLSAPSNASGRDLHQLLLETFPPLSSCGGYSLGKTILHLGATLPCPYLVQLDSQEFTSDLYNKTYHCKQQM